MPIYQLELIPIQKPNDAIVIKIPTVLTAHGQMGIIVGEGDTDYVCGACDSVLISGSDGGVHFSDFALLCGFCGAYNRLRGKFRPKHRQEFSVLSRLPSTYVATRIVRVLSRLSEILNLRPRSHSTGAEKAIFRHRRITEIAYPSYAGYRRDEV
jgi:hypothetical protein